LQNRILRFDLRHEWCLKFLSTTSLKNKLPAVESVAFRYMPKSSEGVNQALENSLEETKKLFVNNYVETSVKASKVDIGGYHESILKAIPKVTDEIWIEYLHSPYIIGISK